MDSDRGPASASPDARPEPDSFLGEGPTIRICHIISSFSPVIGGAERATENLASALIGQGHDVIVITRRYRSADPAFETINGIPVHRLGLAGRGKVHAATFGLHALMLVATRFRAYRILHVQNIDMPTLVGVPAKILPGRRLVATIHGETQIIGRKRSWRGRSRLRLLARAADAVTSINPENTRALIDVGFPAGRIREIPNGVDPAIYRPPDTAERAAVRSTLDLNADGFVALYLGRLRRFKRVDLLVDAWARASLPVGSRLVIVGDGPEAERLRRQAAADPTIRFDGPTSDVVSYLHAADVYVNASGDPVSGWQEGLSVALLEAAFAGLAPIVTSGPGNDVLVQDGVTGLSIPMGDRDALATALERLASEPTFRARLGGELRARVVEAYSTQAVARSMAALYEELGRPT